MVMTSDDVRTSTLSLAIVGRNGTILELREDSALLPSDGGERAQAFEALTNALALLSGVSRPSSSAAKAVERDERCSESGQCQSDRRDGVVVNLAERRGAPARHSTP